MAVTTITIEFKVDGAYFDPDEVVFRDPTGTYGIIRNDTSEIIRVADTPLVNTAVGIYEYVLTDLDEDVNYTAYIQYLYAGEYRYELRAIGPGTVPTPTASTAYNRISARRGQNVNLDTVFYRGGQLADPYAVYRVEIYRGSVSAGNIVDAIDIVDPGSSAYPSPLENWTGSVASTICPSNPCTVSQSSTTSSTGRYRLLWEVPDDAVVPDIYFDVWYYFPSDPGVTDLSSATDQLLSQCNRFWVYPENWYVDGGLQTVRFGFEPLDIKFHKPERRPLEIGVMPLPLYDYNYNLVAPIIPYLSPTITIWTDAGEEVVSSAQCTMKLRQGAYRSNPYVISYVVDTCTLFKGTYKYRIIATLPDSSTRVSGDFYFTVT